MSKTPTTARRRALLVALLVGAASFSTGPTGVAAATPHDRDTAHRWVGYEIPRNGRADGGWIGGYRIDGTPIFVTTPAKEPNVSGYRPAHAVENLDGRRGASSAETERAAWILSKYGGYRDATQAAAVDASVYTLVVGGRWRTTGERGTRRIRQTPQPATVRRFARIMLAQSNKHAGEYHARVRARGADVGGTITATATVTDGAGRPAAGLPVTLVAAGATPVEAVSGDDGRAVARFGAPQPGWRTVTATVGEVPDHRLHLRRPVRRGQATAAEGGDRRTLVATTRAAVRGPQSLALRATPATVLVGSSTRVTATVSGDGTQRAVTGTLHGPFASVSEAHCGGSVAGTVASTVSADGDYVLPPVSPGAAGYYVWQVAVDGTATALPAAACGAATTVKAVAQVSVTALDPEMQPGNAEVRVSLSRLPRYPAVTVTLNVWGPYPGQDAMTARGCSGGIAAAVDQKMNGDATVTLNPYLGEAGWYAVQATVPPGELHQGAQSTCLALGTVLHVS